MAKSSTRVEPKSMREAAKLRIKQRDFTIPVRLNQLPTPDCQKRAALASGESDAPRLHSVGARCFALAKRRSVKRKHACRQCQSIRMLAATSNAARDAPSTTTTATAVANQSSLISNNKIKYQRSFAPQLSAALMVIAAGLVVMLATTATLSNCDTQATVKRSSKPVVSQQQQQEIVQDDAGPAKARASDFNKSLSSRVKDNNNAARKEHLLSYLSENIERQHFKLSGPVKAFVHQRPSKFDSGEGLNYESGESSSSSQHAPGTKQHNSSQSSKVVEKVDEGLRQIMKMHELANIQQAHNRPAPQSSDSNSASAGGAEAQSTSFASRLREFSRGPARVASSLIKPNKVMSHVLSYITPLISNKLSSGHHFFDQKSTSSLLNSTGSLFGLHSFMGRSNNQLSLTKNFLQSPNEDKREPSALSPSSSSSSSATSHSYKPFVTAAPQSNYLAKPDSYEYLLNSARQQYAFTQPTTLLENFGDTVLKSALIKPNISPKDLMADSSSGVSSIVAASPAAAPSSNLDDLSNSVKPEEDARAKILRPASSWLKNKANEMAQSYLQDSFRGLLTLTQLPILQATPISTAPSILEKGGQKSKDPKKTSTQTSQVNRNRAIDELYRYAYILGTSARRKRDPLKALGTNSVKKSLIKQKGVFSQRSRNQLIAPNSNQNQLLNYAKGLKSMLTAGGAKPRGVMWEMATDPSMAVTVFHLLERASVALPLGFLLMPFVKMIHNPNSGINLQGLLPSRALHRSVDYEELAKRLDVVDKMLSRALRSTHRESLIGK